MSQENVELAKILLPPSGTDLAPLIRDEDTYARMAEAVRPLLTDDFESVMAWPAVTRTYAGLEASARTGSIGSSRGRHTEALTRS